MAFRPFSKRECWNMKNDEAVLTAEQVRELVRATLDEHLDTERSLTKAEFCKLERISNATYHKMKNAGYGHSSVRVPGLSIARITPQARRDWHEKIAEWQTEKRLKVEAERRSAQTRRSG